MTDDERGRVAGVKPAIMRVLEDEVLMFRLANDTRDGSERTADLIIAAMREGEQKREGEARAAGATDGEDPYNRMRFYPYGKYGGDNGAMWSDPEGDYVPWEKVEQLIARAEAAESLARAELGQRESEGGAYRKEIAELREHATDDYRRAKRWIGLVNTDTDEVIADAVKERDEARGEVERLRRALELLSIADRSALDMATPHFESWIKHTAKKALGAGLA